MSTRWETFDPREEFGRICVDLGAVKRDFMVLVADLARTCNVLGFKNSYPNNFLNVGICEQNMVGMSAGLAFEGKVPLVTTIAPFLSMRACEQIRTDVCYNNLHVIFVAIMSGISGAPLGSTHYATEDIAIIRSFPNIKLLQPSNSLQIVKAIREAYETDGPVYIRLGSGKEPNVPSSPNGSLFGKAVHLRRGGDISILATGFMVHKALEAADLLEREGLGAGVWDHPSIKPIDVGAISTAVSGETGNVRLMVTLEEHNIYGGFGSAVAEEISKTGVPMPLVRFGLPDRFIGVGHREELLSLHHLDSESIVKTIREALLSSLK